MKHIVATAATLWMLASGAAAAESPAPQPSAPASQPATQPADNHGLVVQVKPDRRVIAAGESLMVTVTVQNRGRTSAKLPYVDYLLVQGISVYAPDGTPAPLTNTGRLRLGGSMGAMRHMERWVLEPGTQSSRSPVVTSYFDMTEPGRYTIRVEVKVILPGGQWVSLTGEDTVEVDHATNAPYSPPQPIAKE